MEFKSCCFTGHRSEKLPWEQNEKDPRCVQLKEDILEACRRLYLGGCRHYICGMATGCDLYFADAVCRLKESFEDIVLEAAIPYASQCERFRTAERAEYRRLLSMCDKKTVLQVNYSRGCFMQRNRYMVDNADILLAAYSGESGGTMQTILYAMRQHKEIITIEI